MPAQPAILSPQQRAARYLNAHLRRGVTPDLVKQLLSALSIDDQLIIGLGPGLSRFIGVDRPEMRPFPALSGVGIEVPSTQADLWIWINCPDRAAAIAKSNALVAQVSDLFECDPVVDGFKNGETERGLGRDLTGYEDGTENPQGDDATAAALAADESSFVAVQTWQHDLSWFNSQTQQDRDHMIGRRLSDNKELSDVPPSAHVKRTAQESFEPEAFVLRRSLPWAGPTGEGLMFIAFGNSFDAFEAQLRRMAGLDDGIIDACFRFSRPTTGGYYWCPPVENGRLQLNG